MLLPHPALCRNHLCQHLAAFVCVAPKYFNQSTNCEVQHPYIRLVISETLCSKFCWPCWQAIREHTDSQLRGLGADSGASPHAHAPTPVQGPLSIWASLRQHMVVE